MDDIINFKIYLQSSSKAMADTEKRGENRNTKIWISEEREKLLKQNKKQFYAF